MHHQGFTKINEFQTKLFRNDWSDLIAQIEGQYLDSEKVQNLRNRAKMDILVDTTTHKIEYLETKIWGRMSNRHL